jgi:hypothetical protein
MSLVRHQAPYKGYLPVTNATTPVTATAPAISVWYSGNSGSQPYHFTGSITGPVYSDGS